MHYHVSVQNSFSIQETNSLSWPMLFMFAHRENIKIKKTKIHEYYGGNNFTTYKE